MCAARAGRAAAGHRRRAMIGPMDADEPITLRLGGAPALRLADGPWRPLDAHGALIAARLVLAGPQPRAALAALLYPGVDDARARANLRQRLLRLKAQAGRAWVDGGDLLQLQPLVVAAPLDDAELLAGVPLPDSDDLAQWLQAQRELHQQARAGALQAALQAAEAAQRLDEALLLAARWVALHPAAEAPRRALARLHYLNHDRSQALAELDRLDALLAQEQAGPPSAACAAWCRPRSHRPHPAPPAWCCCARRAWWGAAPSCSRPARPWPRAARCCCWARPGWASHA